MSECASKVAYLSEFLATNAATLHQFVHPECTDVHAYPCAGSKPTHWHIGHKHRDAGQRCKAEPSGRPRRPYPKQNRPRGAA